MMRPLSTCLSALAIGALIAGCGGSSTSSQTVSATPPTGASGAAANTGGLDKQQAVAICRQAIRLAPYLSATDKATLEGVCDKGASGDTEQARNAFREVCAEVIRTSPVSAKAKEEGLIGCNAKGGQ
jgi:hypothetical protein